MTKSNTLDDTTPPERPPIMNPANRGIVRALSNHVAVLDQVRRMVESVRVGIAESSRLPVDSEMTVLAQAMRAESDSAVEVARAAEAIAKATKAR